MYLWQRSAAAFFIIAAAVSATYYGVKKDAGPADIFTAGLLLLASAWMGALIGGVIDWARYRRSPLVPLFKGRFGWFYGKRFWFRIAFTFALAWAGFIAITLAVAAAVGAKEEISPFLSIKGGLLLLVFLIIFFLEGALVGGVLDVVRYLNRSGKRG